MLVIEEKRIDDECLGTSARLMLRTTTMNFVRVLTSELLLTIFECRHEVFRGTGSWSDAVEVANREAVTSERSKVRDDERSLRGIALSSDYAGVPDRDLIGDHDPSSFWAGDVLPNERHLATRYALCR